MFTHKVAIVSNATPVRCLTSKGFGKRANLKQQTVALQVLLLRAALYQEEEENKCGLPTPLPHPPRDRPRQTI